MKVARLLRFREVLYATAPACPGIWATAPLPADDPAARPLPAPPPAGPDGFALSSGLLPATDRCHHPPVRRDRPPLAAPLPQPWLPWPARAAPLRPTAQGHPGRRGVALPMGAALAEGVRCPPPDLDHGQPGPSGGASPGHPRYGRMYPPALAPAGLSLPPADLDGQASGPATAWVRAKKGALTRLLRHPPRGADVYVQDEAELSLFPTLTRTWMLRGHQKKVRAPGVKPPKRQECAATDWRTGAIVRVRGAKRDAVTFGRLLEACLARSARRKRRVIMVTDRAKIHTQEGSRLVRALLQRCGR